MKNPAIPESERLAHYSTEIQDGIRVHKRIFLCSCQGVTRTTVSTIETLALLLNDEPDIPDTASEGHHQIDVQKLTTTR